MGIGDLSSSTVSPLLSTPDPEAVLLFVFFSVLKTEAGEGRIHKGLNSEIIAKCLTPAANLLKKKKSPGFSCCSPWSLSPGCKEA